MRIQHHLLVLFCASGLTGCFYGYRTAAYTTPLGAAPLMPLVPPESIEMRFGSTSLPDTAYVQVAFLEVKGAKYDDADDLIRQARKKASALGANAVINIEFGVHQGNRGELIGDIMKLTDGDRTTGPDRDEYIAPVLHGVAVYIKHPLVSAGQ